MKIKVWSILLVMLVVAAAVFGGLVTEVEAEGWDGFSSEPFAGGTGTEADPYQIANGKQLCYFSQMASKTNYTEAHYILTADIYLSDKLFPGVGSFEGVLDGNGKTVYGLNIYVSGGNSAGLIKVGRGCVIKNLTLRGRVQNDGSRYTGAFCGESMNCKIYNCHNYCDIIGVDEVGGIAGYFSGSDSSYIGRCSNSGNVVGQDMIGGIAGHHSDGKIYQSFNTGCVSGSTDVGGISGFSYGDSTKKYSCIQDCYNIGSITASTSYAGGIVGLFEGLEHDFYVRRSYNVGTISATSYGGGIIGGTIWDGWSSDSNVKVTDCFLLSGTCANTSHYGTQFNEDAMSSMGAYSNFDFADVWTFGQAGDYRYPTLRCFDHPTVTFCDEDGAVVSQKVYHIGSSVMAPEAPEKEGDEIWHYTFAGWGPNYSEMATTDVTYVPQYEQAYVDYTVSFQDPDGTEIFSGVYHYGDVIEIPADPVKSDETFTYTFTGWDKTVAPICTGDAVYTATYIPLYIDYTVTFQNEDGTQISSGTYHYGEALLVPSDPVKEADLVGSYTFANWGEGFTGSCTGDAVYTASYTMTLNEYTVTFLDEDGTEISSGVYHYGDAIEIPADPTKAPDGVDTYTFTGWDAEVRNTCVGDAVYTATYAPLYRVLFRYEDGSVIFTGIFHRGQEVTVPDAPTKGSDETYSYTFSGWDKEVAQICNGHVTYTAVFEPTYIDYTVVFRDDDGTELSSGIYHYGDLVQPPADPSKIGTDHLYTFSGWDSTVTACTGSKVYTATYKAVRKNKANITGYYGDLSAFEGETIAVTVEATGDGLTYQWYSRDPGAAAFAPVEDFTGDTYVVQMTAGISGQKIYCVAADAYGNSVCSDVYTLTMRTPLTITKQPVSVRVAAGKAARVTVGVEGDGLSFKWYYATVDSDTFKHTSAFGGNSYTITMNATRAGRRVYCVITDAYGVSVTTETVSLDMITPLRIVHQPVSVTVTSGQVARATVDVEGDGLTYKWYYASKGQTEFSYTSSFKSNTYGVSMTAARSGRRVYCVITDAYGNSVTTKTVTLIRKIPLQIVSQPTSVVVASKSTAKVTVKAKGEGLTYTWYYADPNSGTFVKTSSFKKNSYSIVMNESRRGRMVYCVITDKYGDQVVSNIAVLNMSSKLKISKQPVSMAAAMGKKANATVSAVGEKLTYSWFYAPAGSNVFDHTTAFTSKTYSITMNASRAGRRVYCIISDRYGNMMVSDVVTLNKG